MSGPLHTVHVRVNDAATGQPTPVRIQFAGPTVFGNYPPFGRLAFAVSLTEGGGSVRLHDCQTFAYIDGTCEVPLPTVPINIFISKGPEYTPIRQTLTLAPGKMALRFAIERWTNLRHQGWYSGDTAVFFLSPHDALLEGAAEDVAVINLLAAEYRVDQEEPPRVYIPNILAFSGQRPALETPGHMVVVNTHNLGDELGEVQLLNCHRPVYPLRTGRAKAFVYDWTLSDWCDQCHRKAGLVLSTGFGGPEEEPRDGYGGEALAAVLLGKIDAIEAVGFAAVTETKLGEWYRLLNCGLRVPLTGGSWKEEIHTTIGGLRTYARLRDGEEFSYRNWIEAIRAGRTFVTNGPLLSFAVNDQDPGATLALPEGACRVRVRAEARSIVPFERLEFVLNGAPIAATEASGVPCTATLEGEIELPCGGWLAARCWGNQPAFAPSLPQDTVAAHTSPIYVQIPDQPLVPDLISIALLTERIDRMLTWVETKARFETDRTKADLVGTFQAARAKLVQLGEQSRHQQ